MLQVFGHSVTVTVDVLVSVTTSEDDTTVENNWNKNKAEGREYILK
jgi:hypothetical protein